MFDFAQERSVYTVRKEVVRSGIGVFTGVTSEISFSPLPEGSGVVLQRTDLPGAPRFKVDLSFVKGTPRCTIVGNEEFSVQTVEHLMAALYACDVVDVLVRFTGPEVPIFDGSSLPFIEMIEEAGLEFSSKKKAYAISEPIFWSSGDTHLVALPSEEFKISYTLHYPLSSCIGTQFYSFVLSKENFISDLAPCRTFSVYEEILPLIERGFLRGGSLDNAVVIRDNVVMNPGGLRFPDEMVRHKILDLIGDLSLIGFPFLAHIVAIRSGHYANNAFANVLLNHFKQREVVINNEHSKK